MSRRAWVTAVVAAALMSLVTPAPIVLGPEGPIFAVPDSLFLPVGFLLFDSAMTACLPCVLWYLATAVVYFAISIGLIRAAVALTRLRRP